MAEGTDTLFCGLPLRARMQAPGIRVDRSRGETVRRLLQEQGLLRHDLQILREGDTLVFPVTEPIPELEGCPGVVAEFKPAKRTQVTYQEVAEVPEDLRHLLPSSFDVIGHVLLMKLPPELLPYAQQVAAAILRTHPSVRTVALDRGVTGELRVRNLDVVAGEPDTETVHTEYGMRLRVDPAVVYFSPRLSTERHRVATQVRPGEVVVDLFAGVGPFAVLIARLAEPARVHAVDLNPEAYAYLEENLRLNRVEGRVEAYLADAREWAREHPGLADRVIMNLPHTAGEFLEDALRVLKPEGGILHYHCIEAQERLPMHLARLAGRARREGRVLRVLAQRDVRTYSPQEKHFAVDLEVRPEV